MLALRYVALFALVVWIGGLAVLGAIAAPVAFDVTAARHLPDARVVAGALEPTPELKASAAYKRRTAGVLVARAVRQAWREAGGDMRGEEAA